MTKVAGRPPKPAILPFVLLLLTGCTADRSVERSDLEAYLRQLRSWSGVEAELAGAVERILETHFVDEAEVRRQLRESRSRLRTHLAEAQAYAPATPMVRSLQQEYVAVWQGMAVAYEQIEAGLRDADQAGLARGRAGLLQWRRDLRAVAERLRPVLLRHGLLEPETKDGPSNQIDGPSS